MQLSFITKPKIYLSSRTHWVTAV